MLLLKLRGEISDLEEVLSEQNSELIEKLPANRFLLIPSFAFQNYGCDVVDHVKQKRCLVRQNLVNLLVEQQYQLSFQQQLQLQKLEAKKTQLLEKSTGAKLKIGEYPLFGGSQEA